MSDYINKLHDDARRALAAQDEIVSRSQESGGMSPEDEAAFDKAQVDFERLNGEIKRHMVVEENKRVADEARSAYEPFIAPTPSNSPQSEAAKFEQFLRSGGSDAYEVDLTNAARDFNLIRQGVDARELRSILGSGGSSGGSLVVPSEWAQTIYQFVEAASAVRQHSTVFQSAQGGPWNLPRVTTHAVATQVISQGTAIAGSDPVMGTITLNSFKFGELVQVSNEMIEDSAFDIIGFVTAQAGRAVGRLCSTGYATGSGSSTINGIMTAASTGVVTGGTLIPPTAENLIDLQHSVVQEYRDNGAYIMLDATLGTLRKIRADAGGTLGPWLLEPPSAPGQPMGLFGRPVYTDFNIADHGSNAKTVGFGDISRYYIRDTGGFRFERSDDYAFNTDLVSFRGVLRTDGDLIDTAAFKVIREAVS